MRKLLVIVTLAACSPHVDDATDDRTACQIAYECVDACIDGDIGECVHACGGTGDDACRDAACTSPAALAAATILECGSGDTELCRTLESACMEDE